MSGGKHLHRLQVGAFDVADLYRAAWVQAVSALDHWVHRELYDRALGCALNVGAEPLWPNVEKPVDSAVAILKEIVNRRHRIAHEADRDPDDGTRRLDISADEVTRTIDHVQRIAAAIAVVLGPSPAMPLQPVHDEPAAGLTPKQELYRVFWKEFEPVVRRHGWTRSVPPPQNWWDMPSGVTGAIWMVSYSRFGCRSELHFGHSDPATNLARWRVLYERRDEILSRFDDELIFDDLPDNKACRIEARLNGPTITDRAKWPQVRRWMEDTQVRLRAAVEAVGGVPG